MSAEAMLVLLVDDYPDNRDIYVEPSPTVLSADQIFSNGSGLAGSPGSMVDSLMVEPRMGDRSLGFHTP